MREVHDLATGMKDAIASLKKIHVDAKNALTTEIGRSKVNAQKVMSMATDLKAANLEVEDFLGDTKSNFTSSEDVNTHPTTGAKADVNGVTLNPENVK